MFASARDRDIEPIRGERERDVRRNSDDMMFLIPKETVGAVIGKGGHVLKDLYTEFGFRVRVDRDDLGSSRNVVISAPTQGPLSSQELLAMQRCRDKILKIVESNLENVESHARAVEDA
jgi:predicted PilT family ATPase